MEEEIYLRRKIDLFLSQWKSNPDRLPLLIKGPRQIGKTRSILHFANHHYKNVIYVNFSDEDYTDILSRGFHTDDIIYLLSTHNRKWIFEPYKTIIIFDEIQILPDIMTSLKNFKLDDRYDVICSGSLLGVHYKKISHVSVGYQSNYEMKSMDFEEFLWAEKYENDKDNILSHLLSLTPFEKTELRKYNELFKTYCTIGGMPKVVATFIKNHNLSHIYNLQQDIILTHKEDMARYCEGLDVAKIENTYNSIPRQLSKENKKFKWATIDHNARFKDYFACVDWLFDAGLISICYNLKVFELPLLGNYDPHCFKVFLKDSGLLLSQLEEESQKDFMVRNNFGIYKGGLTENIIAEALEKSGVPLIYYRKEDGSLEEDFMLRTIDYIVPLEVKATHGRSRSLQSLIANNQYSLIQFGIKLYDGNIEYDKDNHIYMFPLFCAFVIKEYLSKKYDGE